MFFLVFPALSLSNSNRILVIYPYKDKYNSKKLVSVIRISFYRDRILFFIFIFEILRVLCLLIAAGWQVLFNLTAKGNWRNGKIEHRGNGHIGVK